MIPNMYIELKTKWLKGELEILELCEGECDTQIEGCGDEHKILKEKLLKEQADHKNVHFK